MKNIPHGLKEAIEKDELVLFIGSGLSRKLKNTEGALGGWKEMVSSMLSYLKDKEYITAEEQQSYDKLRPLHSDWCVFCLLIHCIIGSYFVYLSIKNSIILLPWHTNPRIPMSM